MKKKSDELKLLLSKKAFTLLEVVIALAIMCFVISAVVSNFTFTKKTHFESSEYLNKSYLANILLEALKDRVYVNPNFIAKINNLVLQNGAGESGFLFKDVNFNDKIAGGDYKFEANGIPVITHKDGYTYYFGIIRLNGKIHNSSGEINETAAGKMNTFSNASAFEKYEFDIKISNDDGVKPEGMLKNIVITIRKKGQKDDVPFILATKILCPADSLSTSAYVKLQERIFNMKPFTEFYDSLLASITEEDIKNFLAYLSPKSSLCAPDGQKNKKIARGVLLMYYIADFYNYAINKANNGYQEATGGGKKSLYAKKDALTDKNKKIFEFLEIMPLVAVKSNPLNPNQNVSTNPDQINIFDLITNENATYGQTALELLGVTPNNQASQSSSNAQKKIIDFFNEFHEKLIDDYKNSISDLLDINKKLLDENLKTQNYLTAREELKCTKDFVAYKKINELFQITSKNQNVFGKILNHIEAAAQMAKNFISGMANIYKNRNYDIAEEYIRDEIKRSDSIIFLYDSRYKPLSKKLNGFLEAKTDIVKIEKLVTVKCNQLKELRENEEIENNDF